MQANPDLFASRLKICGLLRAVLEELPDAPLYYTLSSLTRTLKCQGPKLITLSNALINAGYRVSNTHCNRGGVKTDAPPEVCATFLDLFCDARGAHRTSRLSVIVPSATGMMDCVDNECSWCVRAEGVNFILLCCCLHCPLQHIVYGGLFS